VIPQAASAAFNIRFNTEHSVDSLQGWLEEHFDGWPNNMRSAIRLSFASNASPFITEPGELTTKMQAAITRLTNKQASLSTTGGTSDARFICKICPVAEFGLVGQTMHKIDEHVAIEDIDRLAAIYAEMLAELDRNNGRNRTAKGKYCAKSYRCL
jgi:succinyl-diaminopimelate desuccinylase